MSPQEIRPPASHGAREPTRGSVRAQQDRILASPDFRANDRRREFLRFVVEAVLAGEADRLKGYIIATEVYGRDEDFDPQADPIVRLEVGRLRRELEHYYLTAGRTDPIVISIPKGGNAPAFETRATEDGVPDEPSPERERAVIHASRPRWVRLVALALGAAALVALTWTLTPHRYPDPVSTGKPFVVVLPLVDAGGGVFNTKLAAGYLEAVIADLTKLSGLSVMAPRSSVGVANEAISLRTLRDDQGVSHVLRGTLASQAEKVRVSVQLIDTRTGAAVWAERFEGDLNDWFALEDKLANRIAAALSVTLHPDESRRVYLRHTSNREAMQLLRHAIISINPPNERGRIEASRSLHQRVIDLDPSFAGGHAGMSQVHSYMVLFEHSEHHEKDLESAVAYAQKSIELDDSFAMGHSMLGLAHSLAGRTDLALAQVRRAVALGPGDPLSYQWLSGVLIFSGRHDEAVSAMQEALRLDPIEPGTPYLNILGMAYFNGEQYELAIDAFEENRKRGGPDAPNMEAYRAAAYAALGRETEAREVIALLNVRPGEISPESWIRRWTPSQENAERAIGDLHRLGMKNRIGDSPDKSPPGGAAGTTS